LNEIVKSLFAGGVAGGLCVVRENL